jgi:general secretion pathway protein D
LIDFFKQDSDAKTLASPKLRVINNKSASINIGDKQPILLSTTNVLPGQAATGAIPTTSTVTSIEFKDTGVKLTVEPSINLLDEVTMKLKIEVTRLGDQVILQASPEIKQFKFGTRSAETTLSLRDDETVVLAGLIQNEERKSRSSIPLLGDIPILGQLFTSTTEDVVQTEVVLTLTPRVVRSMGAPPVATQAMWSGTENAYATTQLFPPRAMKVSQDVPAATAAAPSKTGTESNPVSGGAPTQPIVAPSAQSAPPASGTAAPATQANSEPSGMTKTERIARLPSSVTMQPVDVSATAGQEFRLDVLALQGQPMTEATATVSYDPKLVEFRRVGPGAAAISARATDGQVQLTIRRQGGADQGEAVLAMLFFQAKVKGDATVTLQAHVGGVTAPAGPVAQEQVVVHVQ